ncbi:MAG TPA: hypothetical protein VN201_10780 [Roseateles sp.]|nr:hypothetical protein [Roseateles sp.]
MAAQTRIYTVEDNATGQARLVRATHPSHALTHVARSAFSVRVSTQEDLTDLLPAGVKVEDIKAEQQELPTD